MGCVQLAKASTLALIGMVIIVVTVLVEGFMVPAEQRGSFNFTILTLNGGIFQAIGVISFGKRYSFPENSNTHQVH